MAKRLANAVDPSGTPQRRLTPEEDAFIANERLLSKIDYRYVAERYHYIRGDRGLQRLYPLWEPQEIVLSRLATLQQSRAAEGHPDGLLANVLKARQEGVCLAPDTRILTDDLRWVPIEALTPGQGLVTTDEHPIGGKRKQARRMRRGLVEAVRTVYEPAFRLTLDNGETVTATAPHRLLCRKRAATDTEWREVRQIRVGDQVRTITQPWGVGGFEDGWMGGILDGEGSCRVKSRAGTEVTVTQVPGAVCDRVFSYLRDRGYSVRLEVDAREPSATSKFGQQPVHRAVVGRMNELFRLLGQTRPVRFLPRHWWDGKELPGKGNGTSLWAQVVSITALGPQRMIDLQTSTRTYIAEGVVSHNSTIVQSLVAHRVTTHTHVNALTASDVPENSGSEGIFGKFELIVEHLPWYLRPATKFHKKDTHWVFGNGSWMTVESGKSMKGGLQDQGGQKGNLGRSRTYTVFHLTELSTWERPEQIDDGLLPAVPRSALTLGLKESTAKGRHNWHHEDWLEAVRGQGMGAVGGRFIAIFLPWYALQKYWLPAPLAWSPDPATMAHAQKAEREGPKWLSRPVTLSRNQLYWYEQTRADYLRKGEIAKFLEEYAADPEECFQHSGKSIFGHDQLAYLDQLARPMIDCWAVNVARDLSEIRQHDIAQIRLAKALAATVAESPSEPLAGRVTIRDGDPVGAGR